LTQYRSHRDDDKRVDGAWSIDVMADNDDFARDFVYLVPMCLLHPCHAGARRSLHGGAQRPYGGNQREIMTPVIGMDDEADHCQGYKARDQNDHMGTQGVGTP